MREANYQIMNGWLITFEIWNINLVKIGTCDFLNSQVG